jgi:hypothetical protein
MAWRLGSALLLAALLAGCVDSPEYARTYRDGGINESNGWSDYAMATSEPVMARPSRVVDPSFRISELRVGMTKAELIAMYPGRLALDNAHGRNEHYFVEPQVAVPNSTVSRDRLSLLLNDGRLATFGLVTTNEPMRVTSAPALPAASAMPALLPPPPPPPSRAAPPRGKYAVQVAAPRTVAEARAVIDSMRARYPTLLGREWASISRASTPNGEFYRVLIGPLGSAQQAGQLCNSLRAQGAECFIRGT